MTDMICLIGSDKCIKGYAAIVIKSLLIEHFLEKEE